MLEEDFADRVEPFGSRAAAHYAGLVANRERAGTPIGIAGAQIAAVCLSRRAVLSTRNTEDFRETGIEVVDPWQTDRE